MPTSNYDRVSLKADAKSCVIGVEPHPAYITLLFVVLQGVINMLLNTFQHTGEMYELYFQQQFGYSLGSYDFPKASVLDWVFSIVLSVLLVIITVGYYSYCMKLSKHEVGSARDLFSAFPLWLKIFGVAFFEMLFITLWSLLLVVPGIIAAYRYRLAYYILLDNPDKDPLWCIRESKRLMAGNKARAFVLDLSFLGWFLLILITFGIVGIWKWAYIHTTFVKFYEWTKVEVRS